MQAGHPYRTQAPAGQLGGSVLRVIFLVAMFGLVVGGLQTGTHPKPDTDSVPGGAPGMVPGLLSADAQVLSRPPPTAEPPSVPEIPTQVAEAGSPFALAAPPSRPLSFGGTQSDAPSTRLDQAPQAASAAFPSMTITQPTGEKLRPRAPTPPPATVSEKPVPSAPVPPAPVPPAPAPAATATPAAKPPVVAAAASPPVTAPVATAASADRVDLNSASLEQLNALRGGGLIGRAIVRGRPYTSAEDLMRKRVLSRSAFERIKDQVTVR